MAVYIVKDGDTLESIASKFAVPISNIVQNNHLFADEKLTKGQSLIINDDRYYIDVNGYAYTNINKDTLNSSLPYLTYLSVFNYRYDERGYLISINDTPLIESALKQNVVPLLVLTNIGPSGSFEGAWAHKLLTDDNMQANLLNRILEVLTEKNYGGINVDFEFVYAEDKEKYNNFLQKIADLVHEQDKIMSTAIAPKVRDNQEGISYEGIDYKFHGKVDDKVIIMTYGWGYATSEPKAISPINQLKRVLDYAVTEIPAEKILLGIPNYGYDWLIPHEKGNVAKSIALSDAEALARKLNSPIYYDEIVQTPYFRYNLNGENHEVWFEDVRSLQAKFDLVRVYNLGGISYWSLMNFFTQNFKTLEENYKTNKI